MISTEMSAKDPKWWYDERYAIFDLSINSVTVYPQHDEELETASLSSYRARGYAYGGGGRRISRVEISLDMGRSKFYLQS
jgi:nitrate reductase (NAD(P)H)